MILSRMTRVSSVVLPVPAPAAMLRTLTRFPPNRSERPNRRMGQRNSSAASAGLAKWSSVTDHCRSHHQIQRQHIRSNLGPVNLGAISKAPQIHSNKPGDPMATTLMKLYPHQERSFSVGPVKRVFRGSKKRPPAKETLDRPSGRKPPAEDAGCQRVPGS